MFNFSNKLFLVLVASFLVVLKTSSSSNVVESQLASSDENASSVESNDEVNSESSEEEEEEEENKERSMKKRMLFFPKYYSPITLYKKWRQSQYKFRPLDNDVNTSMSSHTKRNSISAVSGSAQSNSDKEAKRSRKKPFFVGK
jgi:hypothetical protein